ncbi:MAG: hypothetical protein H0W66_00840 [Chthoniobacterales bacterium]|nr:hypothetical protein [Chthoniobacterales bacterium]
MHRDRAQAFRARKDPQGEFKNKNILIQRHVVAETAKNFGLTKEKTEQLLAESRKLLFDARANVRALPVIDKYRDSLERG